MIKRSAFLLSFLCVGALGASSELERARVSLPYTEVARLIERAALNGDDAASSSPPISVIVHKAAYALDCSVRGQLAAQFKVSNLSDHWESVPLASADWAVASIEPAESRLVELGGQLCLLLEPAASASVRLELIGRDSNETRSGQILADFNAIPAVQSSLQLKGVPDRGSVVVTGVVSSDSLEHHYGLPVSGGSVRVKHYTLAEVQGATWEGIAQYLVSEVEEGYQIECLLRLAAADRGRTSEVQLKLPRLLHALFVDGERSGLSYTREIRDAGQLLKIRWDEEDALSRTVRLRYQLPLDSGSGSWSIPSLSVVNGAKMQQAFYVAPFDGVELEPVEREWSTVERLPAWVRELMGNVNVRTITFTGNDSLELAARVLPRMETAVATILEANFQTQLVAEGAMLHQSELQIEHGDRASYEFSVPSEGRLLACAVDGRKVEPLLQPDGTLRLMLPKPLSGRSVTQVVFSYTSKGPAMNPVEGKATLSLPQSTLLTRKLTWAVTIPDVYQATALEGNVVIQSGGRKPGQAVLLSKQIYHGEAPYAALYYTRRDLER